MKGNSSVAKIIISLPICIGIILFISANILNTTVKDKNIKIYGLYGNKIKISDIKDISLEKEMPKVQKVVNGFMLSSGKKKGAFKINNENIKVYSYNNDGPVIFITTEKEKYYLNLKTSNDTKDLYCEILEEK